MANSSLNLVSLDFDTHKESLITFLRSQDRYKDYNFDDSNIQVFLNVLAYNTYKLAFYTNMDASEGFLDSAQMRESLFSIAKELNYVPRSAKSAQANVTISFTANGASQPYIIEKGQTFSAVIKSKGYSFVTSEDVAITSTTNSFSTTIPIYEGYYITDSYVMDYSGNTLLFEITNDNVDLESLSVFAYENGNTIPSTFQQATTLLDLTERSDVFFVQGSEKATYQVVFGDGVLGRRPVDQSIIVLDYRVTAGEEGGGASTFQSDFNPSSGESNGAISVVTNEASFGGADAETNDSIRFRAPRHFQVQERAVTANDYKEILQEEFPEILAISAYGGEEVSPPQFGRVIIAVSLNGVQGLPDSKIQQYKSFLKARCPLTINPVFVSPEFTYVDINTVVKYNINRTTRTPNNLQGDIISTLLAFASDNFDDFNSSLYYSKMIAAIDNVDPISIVSNETTIRTYKKFQPTLGIPASWTFNFNMPLLIGPTINDSHASKDEDSSSVETSIFTLDGDPNVHIHDEGNGVLKIFKVSGNVHTSFSTQGSVDYDSGIVQLVNFKADAYNGDAIKIFATPRELDISSNKNTILQLEASAINVIIEAVRI